MKITVSRYRWKRKPRCRYCKLTAPWVLNRDAAAWSSSDENVCDRHLGLALRNLGLDSLTIEQTAVCTAAVRP